MSEVPKLFITGATGYIGGDALHALYEKHPDWHYTCLVRNSDKGAPVAAKHASVRLVYGDLDSAELIQEEAKNASIVMHFANADHVEAAKAIAAGLSAKLTQKPGYWIHTSGTGILMYKDLDISSYGNEAEKIYYDIGDVAEITSIPDHAPHRNVDKVVLAAGSADQLDKTAPTSESELPVRTAIVCPPTIYGTGRGSGNTKSIQLPNLANCFLERQHGFMVERGKSRWTNVHVHELSDLYVKLAEEAVKGGGKATWGPEGYYFAENGEHVWGETCISLTKAAYKLNLLPSDDCIALSAATVNAMFESGAALWGTNSRARADRARKELGWSPKEDMESTFEELLQRAVKDAGLAGPGHAAVAAGDA